MTYTRTMPIQYKTDSTPVATKNCASDEKSPIKWKDRDLLQAVTSWFTWSSLQNERKYTFKIINTFHHWSLASSVSIITSYHWSLDSSVTSVISHHRSLGSSVTSITSYHWSLASSVSSNTSLHNEWQRNLQGSVTLLFSIRNHRTWIPKLPVLTSKLAMFLVLQAH